MVAPWQQEGAAPVRRAGGRVATLRQAVPTNTTETVAEGPGDATVVRWTKLDDVSLRAIGVQMSFVNRVDCGRHDLFIFLTVIGLV